MQLIEGLRGSAIVTVGGSVELAAAGGPADAETGVVCTPGTRFQIASISKQFAAAAVLLLAERGALALDESINRWFAGAPAQWQQITLHHLLTHTSGIGHWSDTPGFEVLRPLDLDERLDLFQRAPLRTKPGAEWHYSSPGYLLVGHIVERAADQPYAAFLTEQIFSPLGLESTSAGHTPNGTGVARGHRDGEPVATWDLTMMAGTGDIWSTAADIARYTSAVHQGQLLSAESAKALTAPHTVLGAESYGYGLYLGTVAGRRAVYHTGDNPGYVSISVWLPDHKTSVVVLSNDETTDVKRLVRDLLPPA
jgi:CubicO group peptidase (beta-lactamase class C family)